LKETVDLLKAPGVDLDTGVVFEELRRSQKYFSGYKIIVFHDLNPNRVMFSGNSLSTKKFYLLFNRSFGHYNIITNIKAAVAKR